MRVLPSEDTFTAGALIDAAQERLLPNGFVYLPQPNQFFFSPELLAQLSGQGLRRRDR